MKYANLREEEVKNKVARDFFGEFDCTVIIGNVDFCVCLKNAPELFEDRDVLWAEAKPGSADHFASLTQLILTVGKERTFDLRLPPGLVAAYDAGSIVFCEYSQIHDFFYINDFNWNVTPSDHSTREFKLVYARVKKTVSETFTFDFIHDAADLKLFIRENLLARPMHTKRLQIDKNNFVAVYIKWRTTVRPSIRMDWKAAAKSGIMDADFYLADLLSEDNVTLKEKLFVVLKSNKYDLDRKIDDLGMEAVRTARFGDNQAAHQQFWNRFERPPKKDYWDYIIQRRDLLVPQDIRERKGSYFTPQAWVELSQKYLAASLGENWQDEYFIWDCAAGTGNLLAGLTEKYRIWASTLDSADVEVLRDRIRNGANLLDSHVFKFDFLNDSFDNLPADLKAVIDDPKQRQRLIVYINPPYAEADNRKGEGRTGVAESMIHGQYGEKMKYTKREMYIQFLTRIYFELKNCVIGEFSTLKALQAPRFVDFRKFFAAKLLACFIVPADTFDNVKGEFPIGFKIWNTGIQEEFKSESIHVYNENSVFIGSRTIWNYDGSQLINDWAKSLRGRGTRSIGTIIGVGSDFQNQRLVRIERPNMKVPADNFNWQITEENLVESCIYFAVRHSVPATWINNREQFLFPNERWKTDLEFQGNSVVYALFNNNVKSTESANHWIPFTEEEVESPSRFKSNFMSDYIRGKVNLEDSLELKFSSSSGLLKPMVFSSEAKVVMDAGRKIWTYYLSQGAVNPDASFYEIREHFQGRNETGTMRSQSADARYAEHLMELRDGLRVIEGTIASRVTEYGFLN